MNALLRLQGVVVRRQQRDILHGIDLDLSAGEVHALIGPNGSGKTTAVRNLDGDPMVMVARSAERAPAKRGEGIRLRQSDSAVHLFDPSSGDRLN